MRRRDSRGLTVVPPHWWLRRRRHRRPRAIRSPTISVAVSATDDVSTVPPRRDQMRDASKFGADTTAAEVAEGIDLTGKVALVTGGSSGLGQETARVLASRGAEVILTARDLAKGEAVAAAIREATGNPAVSVEALELGSLAQIRAFATRMVARHAHLDILV